MPMAHPTQPRRIIQQLPKWQHVCALDGKQLASK